MYISFCGSWHHGHETVQSQLGFAHRNYIWLYRCFQHTLISEISCMNICYNLSVWVLGFWGFFFASQQDKRKADLMHERNVGPKPIVCYFLQTSMREKMNWVNSSWLICRLFFFSILRLWTLIQFFALNKTSNTCVTELSFLPLLVKGQRRTGCFCL